MASMKPGSSFRIHKSLLFCLFLFFTTVSAQWQNQITSLSHGEVKPGKAVSVTFSYKSMVNGELDYWICLVTEETDILFGDWLNVSGAKLYEANPMIATSYGSTGTITKTVTIPNDIEGNYFLVVLCGEQAGEMNQWNVSDSYKKSELLVITPNSIPVASNAVYEISESGI